MISYERPDGRRPDELRPVLIEPGFVSTATGSALISCGGTRVGEMTINLDCDVLEADGGTRCASITGAYVALALGVQRLVAEGRLASIPLSGEVAAVSCGIVGETPLLDLNYIEDSSAEVDANVVMTGDGGLIEVQATAEKTALQRTHLDDLLVLAAAGIEQLRTAQDEAIAAGSR